jgi:poly-gamma-glutamate capsule biosynthesis protein CapA/YwtB (metallophosphatase superfamily)
VLGKTFYLCLCVSALVSCSTKPEPIRLFFAGDILLDRGVRERIEHVPLDSLLAPMNPIMKTADFCIGNLECPVTSIKEPIYKKYVFRGDTGCLGPLRRAGFTHLVLANNHSYDQGRDGLADTYQNLKRYGIVPAGYGNSQSSACDPVIIHKRDLTVALFSSVTLNLEGWMYFKDSAGICQATVEELADNIAAYKKAHPSHLIIVSLHWGVEFQSSPEGIQVGQASQLTEAGADLVVGHHPHVVQDTYMLPGKFIYYSLGNFIFDQQFTPANKGLALMLEWDGDSLKVVEHPFEIVNCAPTPFTSSVSGGEN